MPLRLKSLELHGYKTFATRTVFEFASGITAIVGPNGSGKSNIADALRWVLGEQSFSLLRAKRTEDMIFSGSEQRPRAGMASATVIFDNEDNWLPLDFVEVGLARRAYRDGRNEYFLNGQHVRLREIIELLSQSGLSERTYTILGQGLVDASLALKADERRRLFEEAAGISLYRSRREEALRRLETTKRNLERIQDIMAELEPRLRNLERQAKKAQEFSRVQADLRVLLLDWYGYHWHRAQQQLAEGRESLRIQDARLNEARQAYQHCQQDYVKFRERLQELRARLSSLHQQSAQLHNSRETVSRDLAVLEERRRALLVSQEAMLGEQARISDEQRLASERLAEASKEFARLQSDYDEATAQTASVRQALESRQAERTIADEKLREVRQSLEALNSRRAESQARLDELQIRLDGQREKLAASAEEIAAAETALQQAKAGRLAARQALARTETELRQAEVARDRKKKTLENLEKARRERLEARQALETEQARLQTQLEVLQQAEQALTGYTDGARLLLEASRQSRLNGVRGAISAALDVPAEYEVAIAAALEDSLDAIVLETGKDAEKAIGLLETGSGGRTALLPIEWLARSKRLSAPEDPDCLGVAADLVHAGKDLEPVVDLLLGRVLIARHRKAARRLVEGQPMPVKAVTLHGEVFRADGLVIAGQGPRSGTLGRPRQRRELQHALDGLAGQVSACDDELRQLDEKLSTASAERNDAEFRLQSTQRSVGELQAALQKAEITLESARRHSVWILSQRDSLKEEIAQAEVEHKKVGKTLLDVEKRIAQAHEESRLLNIRLASLELDETQEQVAYWTTRLAVAERAMGDAGQRKDERQQVTAQLEEQVVSLAARIAQVGESMAGLDSERENLRKQEGSINAQITAHQAEIEPAEKELRTAEDTETGIQEKEVAAQRSQNAVERVYAQVQLDVTRRQEALEGLRGKIEDDFGLVEFAYDAEVAGPVPLPLEGMVEQLPVLTSLPPELEDQVAQQRAILRRMGPVNPDARQEYEKEQERYNFLINQIADLHKAEADLRQVIAELDELTQRDFHNTFQAVAEEFRKTFVQLFGGGSARLTLTDPDNLVETGIDIEARLPGRREQGLALLSGGERSLTAIALVFALLKVSPTPVCVMDEVDAMLDEANVARFREMLEELSHHTQFIIITHNRNTIQAADVIYGVTMGRDSTSQVISLKLDEVSEELLRG